MKKAEVHDSEWDGIASKVPLPTTFKGYHRMDGSGPSCRREIAWSEIRVNRYMAIFKSVSKKSK